MTSVSTGAFYDTAIYNMNQLRASTQKLQAEISSGNKLASSADDPVAAAQMRSLQRSDALATADSSVSDAAKTGLTLTDSTLSQITNLVSQVKTLAVQAANGTLNASQRASVGTQITADYTNLLALANSKDANGNALFGGQGTGQAYTVDAAGNVTYAGGASAAQVSLGPGMSVTTGVTGPEFLQFQSGGASQDLLGVLKNLGASLSAAPTTAAANAAAQAAAQASLTVLDDGLASVSTAQTLVGARLTWVSATTTMQTQLNSTRSNSEASVGGTDITTAAAMLSQQMTVLEASQASFTKLAGLTLFNSIN